MSSVQEIEEAIKTLSPSDQEKLYIWMDEQYARAVDEALEGAVQSGVFDDRIRQALADHASGNTRAL